jgi:Fe-S-cluster containining protein
MLSKLTRTLTSLLPVENHRTGSCNQCGECCRLPFTCFFLRTGTDGKSYCSAYRFRPPTCRKFPRTGAQLELVRHACGFSFAEAPHAQPACTANGDDCLNGPVTAES